MRKIGYVFLAFLGVCVLASAGILLIPNPVRNYLIGEAKAAGYIQYQPVEAYNLARKICTQCHSDERIKKYCARCGPPFIAVVPHMQSFIENYKTTRPNLHFTSITEHQAVAIVQVWNAVVGDWERDFREEDMLKLIGNYQLLRALYKTPVEKRPIESALMNRDDLKIGYMNDMKKSQSGGIPQPEIPGREKAHEHEHEHAHEHDHSGHEGM